MSILKNNSHTAGSEADSSRRFAMDVVWIGVSNLVLFGGTIVVLPLLTKGYPTVVYGLWTQMTITALMLVSVASVRFEAACARFLPALEDRREFVREYGAMLWTGCAFAALLAGALALVRAPLSRLLFASDAYGELVLITCIWMFLQTQYQLLLAFFRARRLLKTQGIVNTVFQVGRLGTIAVTVMLGYPIQTVALAVAVVYLVSNLAILGVIVADSGLPTFSVTRALKYLPYSLPLVPEAFMLAIIELSSRYFISHYTGDVAQTGVYAASCTLSNTVMLVMQPVAVVLLPNISRAWERQNLERVRSLFSGSMKFLLVVGAPAVVGIALLSQYLLKIFATSEYCAGLFLVLMIAGAMLCKGLYQVLVFILHLQKRTSLVFAFLAVAAGLALAINVLLVPRIGFYGAALSTLLPYLLLLVIFGFWTWRAVRATLGQRVALMALASAGAMFATAWSVQRWIMHSVIVSAIVGALIYVMIIFFTRTVTLEEIRMILRRDGGRSCAID